MSKWDGDTYAHRPTSGKSSWEGKKNHLGLVRGGRKSLGEPHLCLDFVFPQTGAICMPSASSSVSLGRTDQLLLSLLCLLIETYFQGRRRREENNICCQVSLHVLSGVNRPGRRCEHVRDGFHEVVWHRDRGAVPPRIRVQNKR